MTKYCSTCDRHLNLDHFAGDSSSKDGKTSKCKACQKKYTQQHYKNNIDSYRRSRDRNKYGLTDEESDLIEELRLTGYCMACGKSALSAIKNKKNKKSPLVLDHNHFWENYIKNPPGVYPLYALRRKNAIRQQDTAQSSS